MKRVIWLGVLTALMAMPNWVAAQEGHGDYDHGQFGIFADYFRFSPGSATTNFVGFGARAAFNTSHHVQLEAEMNYDFQRNFTTFCSNCVSTSFVTTKVRPLTGLFGPKFQTPGPFKFFVTGKVGFINFTKTNALPYRASAVEALTLRSIRARVSKDSGGRSGYAWKQATKYS